MSGDDVVGAIGTLLTWVAQRTPITIKPIVAPGGGVIVETPDGSLFELGARAVPVTSFDLRGATNHD